MNALLPLAKAIYDTINEIKTEFTEIAASVELVNTCTVWLPVG